MMMQSNNNNNNCNNKDDRVKFKVFLKKEEQNEKRPRSKIISLSKQSLSFAHLEAQIVEHFHVKHFIVCYQDEEDDQVTISSDEELQGAISAYANKRTVCLLATLMTNCTSSSATASTSSAIVEKTEEEKMTSLLSNSSPRALQTRGGTSGY